MTLVPRTDVMTLGAAAIVAACGLVACAEPTHPAAAPLVQASASSTAAPHGGPALPPDFALIEVMSKLSDPALPGEQKVALIEGGTAEEATDLDRFGIALRDSGSLPLTFEARDLAWSQSDPGNVTATVLIRSANPANGEFSFPMEFADAGGSWQLTRQTADLLLGLGSGDTAATTTAPQPAIEPPPPITAPGPNSTPPR
ncbi:MAG: hypothetical protein AB7G47_16670 [Mycolicibacterium sp.]|uniref:hypothetical protein n=1 Tax=Mycolicibacterium sp. TaxID=2320850 RepID=UPI003D0E26EC